MGASQERADELVSLLRARFPAARVEVTSNERDTVWVEAWHRAGHAEAVFLRAEAIGVTDFREELGPDDTPFEPWAHDMPSVAAAFAFLAGALT